MVNSKPTGCGTRLPQTFHQLDHRGGKPSGDHIPPGGFALRYRHPAASAWRRGIHQSKRPSKGKPLANDVFLSLLGPDAPNICAGAMGPRPRPESVVPPVKPAARLGGVTAACDVLSTAQTLDLVKKENHAGLPFWLGRPALSA